MDEIEFREWLEGSGKNKRVVSDAISRAKALQRELGVSLNDEYRKDKCKTIMEALSINKGENELMRKYGDVKLPIGKASLGAYRYALRAYVEYKNY